MSSEITATFKFELDEQVLITSQYGNCLAKVVAQIVTRDIAGVHIRYDVKPIPLGGFIVVNEDELISVNS